MHNKKLIPVAAPDGTNLKIQANSQHEFIMSSREVAKGFGVETGTLRLQKKRNADELIEGKHWITLETNGAGIEGVTNCNTLESASAKGGTQKATFWTKRGIVRLGFFIKSEQAKAFRDWAEDYLIDAPDTTIAAGIAAKTEKPRGVSALHTGLPPQNYGNSLPLIDDNGTFLIDTRIIAEQLGISHHRFHNIELNVYRSIIIEQFGSIRTQIVYNDANTAMEYSLLTSLQALLFSSYLGNAPRQTAFKAALIKTFDAAKTRQSAHIFAQNRHIIQELLLEVALSAEKDSTAHHLVKQVQSILK